jgi:adenylate cyclase
VTHEIERKFLVRDNRFLEGLAGERLLQGYIANTRLAVVRVRVSGNEAWLTIKGRAVGIVRREFEYPIPLVDAEAMIAELCDGPVVSKLRYLVEHGGHTWEVDVFDGANRGLVVAEIELDQEDQHFERPDWLGTEVSHDPRYLNVSLARHPYREWGGEPSREDV